MLIKLQAKPLLPRSPTSLMQQQRFKTSRLLILLVLLMCFTDGKTAHARYMIKSWTAFFEQGGTRE